MSFINMLANDVWSDADISNRTEAMVRSVMSVQEEIVLNRKVQGAAMGQYELTPEDQQQIQTLAQVGYTAMQAGIEARGDMMLLHQVFAVEAAERRLAEPVVELVTENEVPLNQEEFDADQAERVAAQAVIASASPAVLTWVGLRLPTVAAID